jgi:hypothetical protein
MFLESRAFSSMKEERTAQRLASDGCVDPDKKKGRRSLLRSNPISWIADFAWLCHYSQGWSAQHVVYDGTPVGPAL